MPWLRLGNRPNLSALLDRGPHSYWFRIPEAAELLRGAGLRIAAIGTRPQIVQGRLCASPEELVTQPLHGGLYVVCKK